MFAQSIDNDGAHDSFRPVDAMDIETALEAALEVLTGPSTPPRLAGAMRAAVQGGASRTRPKLVLGVADAHGRPDPEMAMVAACAIELLHCASLVHDDLPCFDDADRRRGRPTVHVAYGEPLAVLTGDALITGAFELLTQLGGRRELRALLSTIARGVGPAGGIVAGQAWESEPHPDLRRYHRAKTGALFEAAFAAGAIVSGVDPGPWRPLGTRLGEAYQIADDLADRLSDADALGKPVGQDARLDRPNAVQQAGVFAASDRLRTLLGQLIEEVPAAPRRAALVRGLERLAARLLAVGEGTPVHRPARPLTAAALLAV